MQAVEMQAQQQGIETVFVLTTVSGHWFREQGFVEANLDALPESKKELYNFQRKSKVFMKRFCIVM